MAADHRDLMGTEPPLPRWPRTGVRHLRALSFHFWLIEELSDFFHGMYGFLVCKENLWGIVMAHLPKFFSYDSVYSCWQYSKWLLVGGFFKHQFYFPINIVFFFNHPNWRTHIFQRGGQKPPTRFASGSCGSSLWDPLLLREFGFSHWMKRRSSWHTAC